MDVSPKVVIALNVFASAILLIGVSVYLNWL